MPCSDELEADYVVVGGGTAGCILASRLSERADTRIVLIEAGPRDWNPKIHIPIGFSRLLNDGSVNWCYETEPQEQLNGRRIPWPRGKVIGGSSSINGMVWVRGDPEDFDEWSRLTGDPSWSWDGVKPYFTKLEAAPEDQDARLGRSGVFPLETTHIRNPAVEAFLAACKERGLPSCAGLAISDRSSSGHYLTTTYKGLRVSSAKAYLRPARHRSNLRIVSGTHVSSILFDDHNVANGVRICRGGNRAEIRARHGVVLAAGVINSPQLLMLSGIGPAEQLKEHGLPVRKNLGEVGRNLCDHFGVRVVPRIEPPVSVNSDFRRPWRFLVYALQYAVLREGPLTMGGAHAGAFFAPCGDSRPTMQVNFLPLSVKGSGWNFHSFSAVTANVCQLRPASKGQVTLRSTDPRDAPAMDPDYLGEPADREAMISGVRFVKSLLQDPAFRGPMGAREFMPDPDIRSDHDILEFMRRNGSTVFHPVGTCRMGADPGSVVTSKGTVRGTQRLWVADASIMPSIPSGNTNAATAMIAERLSECIRDG